MNDDKDDFVEDPEPAPAAREQLVLDLEGFEGPIDVLLRLARDQKVDLTRISILQLADQYIEFIRQARGLQLDVAADYLVMAAWLAYLKSRLLLPEEADEDEPSGEEMAAMMAFQLQRLEAMRNVAGRLMARAQLGRDFFPRGAPEGLPTLRRPVYELTLFEILKAYATQRRRGDSSVLDIEPHKLYSMANALQWLSDLVGRVPNWEVLTSFLPPDLQDGLVRRSAVASAFAASLELVRQGRLELRQGSTFGPIMVRNKPPVGALGDSGDAN